MAFIGISLGLIVNGQFLQFKFILAVIAVFIILIGCYLYIRALQFGRYLAAMIKDLNLGSYLESRLPRLLLVTRLNQRLILKPNKWT